MTPTRTDRYLAIIDQRLLSMRTLDGRRHLAQDVKRWEVLYANFRAGRVPVTADGPFAEDFLLTISGLNSRLARYSAKVAA